MKSKCNKTYAIVVFVIAVVLCYMVLQQSHDFSPILIFISKAIEVLLPVLGISALVKYIACGHKGCCCKTDDASCGTK